ADGLLMPARAESFADRRARPALPNDRRVDRATRRALPHDGRLALIGDPDGGELMRGESRAREGFAPDRDGCREDLLGIVFDLSRRRIGLPYLAVRAPTDRARFIEDDRGRAAPPLIERDDRGPSVLKRRIGSISRR